MLELWWAFAVRGYVEGGLQSAVDMGDLRKPLPFPRVDSLPCA
jgi:hypothetical protein